MWSNGGTEGGTGDSGAGQGHWNQWSSFNPYAFSQSADAAQVDWAALAQQWIQMKDTQHSQGGGMTFQQFQAQHQIPPEQQMHLPHQPPSTLLHQQQLPGIIPATTIPKDFASFSGMLNPSGFPMEACHDGRRLGAEHNRPLQDLIGKDEWSNSSDSFPARDFGNFQGQYGQRAKEDAPIPATSVWDAAQHQPLLRDHQGGNSSDGNDDGNAHFGDYSRSNLDAEAIRRKSLPAWIREGLEKVEREKRKKLEKEQRDALQARLQATENETSNNKEDMEDGNSPPATKWAESEEESEDENDASEDEKPNRESHNELQYRIQRFLRNLNRDESVDEMMLCIRRQMTSILLQGTSELMAKLVKETLEKHSKKESTNKKNERIEESNGNKLSPVEKDGDRKDTEGNVSSPVSSAALVSKKLERNKNSSPLPLVEHGSPDSSKDTRHDRREDKSRSSSRTPEKTESKVKGPKSKNSKRSRSSSSSSHDGRHSKHSKSSERRKKRRTRSRSRSRTRHSKTSKSPAQSRSRSRSRTPSRSKKSKAHSKFQSDSSRKSRKSRSRSSSRSRRKGSKDRKKAKRKKSKSRSKDRSEGRSYRRTEGKKRKKRRSSSSSSGRRK